MGFNGSLAAPFTLLTFGMHGPAYVGGGTGTLYTSEEDTGELAATLTDGCGRWLLHPWKQCL